MIDKRPWGFFEVLFSGHGCKVKRIVVYPGCRISLQRHMRRREYWVVVKGSAEVEITTHDSCELSMHPAPDSVMIPIATWHRLTNNQLEDLVIIETQTGVCDEDDIERKEDDYGRA